MNIKHIPYLAFTLTSITLCMDNYPCQYMGKNPDKNKRKQIEIATSIKKILELGDDNIILQNIISPGKRRYGECHNWTLAKKMGIAGNVPEIFKNVAGCAESYYAKNKINILEHFYPITIPQAGDIAIYLSDDKPISYIDHITHTGIVTKDGNIESKWGTIRAIFKHPLWYVPEYYGNHILFFRTDKTESELLNAVLEKLKNPELQKRNNEETCRHQQYLYNLANNKYPIDNITASIKLIFTYPFNNDYYKNYFADEIEKILESHMNINPNKPDANGKTALMFAAQKGDVTSIILLRLIYNVEIDAQDQEGNTALMRAVMNKQYEAQNILIRYGAQLEIKNNHGLTALMLAAQIGNEIAIDLLASIYKVNINTQDQEENTALMHSAMNGHYASVNLLINNGADPNIKNNNGLTAENFEKIHLVEACIKEIFPYINDFDLANTYR